MVWRKKVSQSSTLNQAGDWTWDLLVGSQEILPTVPTSHTEKTGFFFCISKQAVKYG